MDGIKESTLICSMKINLFTLVLFTVFITSGFAQETVYGVGFERMVVWDSSRVNVHAEDSSARPVIINMWYPSNQKEGEKIPYRRYLEFENDGVNPYLSRSLEKYNAKMTRHYLFESRWGQFKLKERKAYKKFLNSSGLAIEGTPSIKEKFPLVVYHQGAGAPIADNQEFCEYLASKGYVVCNAAYQYNDKKWPGVGWDPKVSVPDVDILIEEVRKKPFVSNKYLGLMGHSIGGDVGLAYLALGKYKVNALVTLDAHFGYCQDYIGRGNVTELLNVMWENLEAFNVPMLNTASYAFFPVLDSLVHSPRTYLEVGQIGHEDFTSNRVEGRRLLSKKGKMDEQEKQIVTNHMNLRKYLEAFLENYLKPKTERKELLPFGEITDVSLPSDQFLVTNLNVGENPFARNPKKMKLDDDVLKKYEGTYEAKVDGKKYRCKVYVKGGELKRIGDGNNQDYFWDANFKSFEHPFEFRTETNYIFHTYVWGRWLMDEEGNVEGFVTKWFTRKGGTSEAVNVKVD